MIWGVFPLFLGWHPYNPFICSRDSYLMLVASPHRKVFIFTSMWWCSAILVILQIKEARRCWKWWVSPGGQWATRPKLEDCQWHCFNSRTLESDEVVKCPDFTVVLHWAMSVWSVGGSIHLESSHVTELTWELTLPSQRWHNGLVPWRVIFQYIRMLQQEASMIKVEAKQTTLGRSHKRCVNVEYDNTILLLMAFQSG